MTIKCEGPGPNGLHGALRNADRECGLFKHLNNTGCRSSTVVPVISHRRVASESVDGMTDRTDTERA